MTNTVENIGGIPGVGKTKLIDKLFRNNPDVRKIFLPLSHKQADEREDFLTGIPLTHWYGVELICPLKDQEPIKTFFEINMPVRWLCRICQSLKLSSVSDCPHKTQFKNPPNTVIAPVSYVFTQHIEKYDPQIVAVDDIILQNQDLPSRNEMKRYVHLIYRSGSCDYKTLEELYEAFDKSRSIEEGLTLFKQYILGTIEPKLKAGINRLLEEGSDISKEVSKMILQIDPLTLLDWYRLVKVYGWKEKFSIPLLMPVFKLALEKGRQVFIVGAQINKPFLEMMARNFLREYGYPITLEYRKMELDQPLAKSVVYRVRSPKYEHAWYPTTTSITKSRVTRQHIKERIEIILLNEMRELKDTRLTVGIIKPKNAPLTDFLTPLVENYGNVLSLDFGSLQGSNQLEWCDILIIVGTYNINITDLQQDFEKVYHKKPSSVEAVKQFDGGYVYLDQDLENYRRMMEDYEMYQAIHRARPALRERKVYVFGLIPREIYDEFEIRDIMVKKGEGGMNLIEWESFDKWMHEKIGEGGIFQTELVKAVQEKYGLSDVGSLLKVKRFVKKHHDVYEIVEKNAVGEIVMKYVQKR